MKNLEKHLEKLVRKYGEDLFSGAWFEDNMISLAFTYYFSGITEEQRDYYTRLEQFQKAIDKFLEKSTRYKKSTALCDSTVYWDFYKR